MTDRRVAAIVRGCRDLPGQELFQFEDGEGGVHAIGSGDVNAYLRTATGEDLSAKDFRTWAATLAVFRELRGANAPAEDAVRTVARAIERAAALPGNAPRVCREAYVHPAVISAYLEGRLERRPARRVAGLEGDEAGLVALLARGGRRT